MLDTGLIFCIITISLLTIISVTGAVVFCNNRSLNTNKH